VIHRGRGLVVDGGAARGNLRVLELGVENTGRKSNREVRKQKHVPGAGGQHGVAGEHRPMGWELRGPPLRLRPSGSWCSRGTGQAQALGVHTREPPTPREAHPPLLWLGWGTKP
jgi:hypothetical protein